MTLSHAARSATVLGALALGALAVGSPAPLAAQAAAQAQAAGQAQAPVHAQAPAQAEAGAQADAIDPAGTYDFIATLGIEMRTGTIEVRPDSAGHLGGEVRLQGESAPALIETVVVTGQHVRIVARVNGQLMVTIDLEFTGPDAFSGTIAVPDDSIVIDGTRRKQ